jgi:hypothetical protein
VPGSHANSTAIKIDDTITFHLSIAFEFLV